MFAQIALETPSGESAGFILIALGAIIVGSLLIMALSGFGRGRH